MTIVDPSTATSFLPITMSNAARLSCGMAENPAVVTPANKAAVNTAFVAKRMDAPHSHLPRHPKAGCSVAAIHDYNDAGSSLGNRLNPDADRQTLFRAVEFSLSMFAGTTGAAAWSLL